MVENLKQIRLFSAEQRAAKLQQYRRELMELKSQLSAGGSIDDPGKISSIKRAIAQILTIQREEELGITR